MCIQCDFTPHSSVVMTMSINIFFILILHWILRFMIVSPYRRLMQIFICKYFYSFTKLASTALASTLRDGSIKILQIPLCRAVPLRASCSKFSRLYEALAVFQQRCSMSAYADLNSYPSGGTRKPQIANLYCVS